jgi:hypothetical protein
MVWLPCCLVDDLGLAQALPEQVQVPLRGGDPFGRFLLERVEDVQDALEADRVDGAIGIAVKVVANLQDAAAETLEGLGAGRMLSELRLENALADRLPDFPWECPQVFPAGADEDRRLDRGQEIVHIVIVILL